MIDYQVEINETELELQLEWFADGQAQGDYRFFVHLYDDINQPPIVQWDNYAGNGRLPVGNWLTGRRQDTIHLNIDSLVAGDYQLMIGFYDSVTLDRLHAQSNHSAFEVLDDGRLLLQRVEIK